MIAFRRTLVRVNPRAFTLVEVLIATMVLGLGVLGLSALFAGAARQQQSAAELSRAVIFSQNAASYIRPKLGDLVANGSGPTLANGVWDALMTDQTDNLLRSRFALTPGSASLFFNASGIKTTYIASDITAPSGPTFLFGNTFTGGPGVSGRLFDPPLSHSLVVPDSQLRVRVDWGAPTTGPSGPGPIGGVVFQVDTTNDPDFTAFNSTGVIPEFIYLFPGGVNPNATPTWTVPNPSSPEPYVRMRLGGVSGEKARIEEVHLGASFTPGTDVLKLVIIDSYSWLNDQVVSINDRLLYTEDESFPGDRRPTTGYSLLYRVRPNGIGAEAAIVTYALRPLSVPDIEDDEFSFIPPETQQSYPDSSILREIPATLAFDTTTGSYLIRAVNAADNWITDPGQILLMSSEVGVASVNPSTNDFGADAPVRVLTRRQVAGTVMGLGQGTVAVGVLDDSPRINRQSPVPNLTGAMNTIPISVWAVAPIVVSLGSDATSWKVTPIDVRVFSFIND